MSLFQVFKPMKLGTNVSIGLVLLRFVVGLAFMFHGFGKIQSPFGWMGQEAGVPGFLQMLAAVSEFFGGLAWILGLATPLFSFGLLCTMAVATYMHAVVKQDPFVAPGGASYELASVYLCVAILLLLAGPGRFSLDRAIFGERD